MNKNDFLILCKQPIIPFDRWFDIYNQIRKNKNKTNFGYGIKVESKEYSDLENLRKDIPLKNYFFFLISNKHNREFPIHVDGIPGKNNAASINWPLLKCDERSPTRWYNCNNTCYTNLDNSFFLSNINDAIEIYSDVMYSSYQLPYLFRSDVLHKGYCNIDESGFRIIVKWELNFNDWNQACREFLNRDYI